MSFAAELLRAAALPPEEAVGALEGIVRDAKAARADEAFVANALVHLADAASRAGDGVGAERHLREAVRRFTRACGPRDARTLHAEHAIAGVRRARGDIAGALAAERAMLSSDEGSQASALAWLQVEADERALGLNEAADTSLDRALVLQKARCARDPLSEGTATLILARRLVARGREGEAEAALTEALRALQDPEKTRLSPSARVPSAVRRELEAMLSETQEKRQASP